MQQSGCQTVLLPRLRVSELNLDAMEQEDEMDLADMPLVEEWEDGKAVAFDDFDVASVAKVPVIVEMGEVELDDRCKETRQPF